MTRLEELKRQTRERLTIICAELKAEKQARKAGSHLNEEDIIDVTGYRVVE